MEQSTQIRIKKIDKNAKMPQYAKKGDAGADLYSVEQCQIKPGQRRLVRTGLVAEIPDNYSFDVRPKSGLALKKGITVLNTPGTVDSGYRGEIAVILINHGNEDFEIEIGDKITQAVITPIEIVDWIEDDNLDMNTERGQGGFGSTGKK